MEKPKEQKYSRDEIADQKKRTSVVEELRHENKGIDKKKLLRGKKNFLKNGSIRHISPLNRNKLSVMS